MVEHKTKKAPRKLKQPRYKTLRLQKRIKPKLSPLPTAPKLFINSLKVLKRNWKLFLSITLIYAVLNIILVRGFSAGPNISSTKLALNTLFHGHVNQLAGGFTLFVYLLGNSGSTASGASASGYQAVLLLITSLALIWALRQIFNSQKVRARDSFYKGMAPVIPFLLVLMVISLQLLPLIIGTLLYSVVMNGGIAVYLIEKIIWTLLLLLVVLLSFYMISSSIFALYVVTLPNMTPMKALRSARELVRYRRWIILRKVLFLPVILLIIAAAILVPVIIILPAGAAWLFFLMSMLALSVIHGYLYSLYRELLPENA